MKIKTFFKNYAHIFAAILIIIQPIMDITSFWVVKLGYSNAFTTIFRLLIFLITIIYGYIVSNKKSIYYLSITTTMALYMGHLLSCYEFGISNILGDFANYTRIIVMPLSTISLISLIKCNDKTFDYLKKSLGIVFLIMFCIQILSTLTGTDPHTYNDQTGIIGWFIQTSSQSANLTTLAPFFILLILSNKKVSTIPLIFLTILTCLSMFLLATRLAYLGIITIMLGLGGYLIILNKQLKKESIIFISLAIIFICLIPVSPMTIHRNNSSNFRNKQQILIDNYLKRYNIDSITSLDSNKKLTEQIAPIYTVFLKDFTENVGLSKTINLYNYSTNIKTFADVRHKKILFANLLMQDSPNSTKWFGIELSRFTANETVYDVENDFHGIYYLFGRIGLILCISFLSYFIYLIIYALTKDIKKYFTTEAAICGIAFINNLSHIYNTAGVLRRPNASIYLAALLALIYYLIKIKKYDYKKY